VGGRARGEGGLSGAAAWLALSVGLAGAAAVCGWRGARPWAPSRGPRLAPWRLLMLTLGLGALVALAHAAGLVGLGPGAGS
jgi:hypothetical protein